jgi:hypothetical protein
VKRLITKKKNSEYKSSSTTPEEKHLLKPTAGDIVHALGNMINKRSLHEQEGYPIRPAEGYPRWKAASEVVQRGVVTFSSNAHLEKPYPGGTGLAKAQDLRNWHLLRSRQHSFSLSKKRTLECKPLTSFIQPLWMIVQK